MQETSKLFDHTKLKRLFNLAETINHNYSQCDQDIFVLSMLNGLRDGTYLEIGAAWPEHISNTALLERAFNWSGISVDSWDIYTPMWQSAGRKNQLTLADALQVDFNSLLAPLPKTIDYLSIDCDPSDVTWRILQRIPFDTYQFKVITFEHDCYRFGPEVKLASRKFLQDLGYQLVVNNISHIGLFVDFEDWWVKPELVDADRLLAHIDVGDSIKNYKSYLHEFY